MHYPTCTFGFTEEFKLFGIWRPLLNKNIWPLLHLSIIHCLYFAKSNHTIHACCCHLNTLLICPRIRIEIQFFCTFVLTSPPYFTSYHSAYLHTFAVKMWEFHSYSELKLPIWCPIPTHVRKSFERRNMIGWGEAGQLQMDQSAALHCLKFGFCLQCTSGMSWVPLFQQFRYC